VKFQSKILNGGASIGRNAVDIDFPYVYQLFVNLSQWLILKTQ